MYQERGEAPMSFSLVSASTGAPIEGVRISATVSSYSGSGWEHELGVTGPDGKCSVRIPYQRNIEGPFLYFEDGEGLYMRKDTTLADLREREIVIKLYSK